MFVTRLFLISLLGILLTACEKDPPAQQAPGPISGQKASNPQGQSVTNPQPAPTTQSVGGVKVKIMPENPTSTGCLRAAIEGLPGNSNVVWTVNNEAVPTGAGTQLCNDHYKRDDLVSVQVGTVDQGAQASVTIANSPPRIVGISSTPGEIFSGTDVVVEPAADDADGDVVGFTYQWLINGDADPLLTESKLPGDRFTKGDQLQVLIVPYDSFGEGPTYESYVTTVPNAAPRITSEPPQEITALDYQYQVAVSDPDDSTFTYRLPEAPTGMTIDTVKGLIRWSLVGVPPGPYRIAIVVTDPDGAEGAQEYSLTLTAPQ